MPALRQNLPKVSDMDDWFPVAECRPVVVGSALLGIDTRNELTKDQKQWWELTPMGQSAGDIHPKGHWFNFIKLSPDDVCGTIPKASGNAKMCYWDAPYGVSIEGYKRIASFPFGFLMSGNYGNDKAVIGNSVPPLFMRAIARNIKSMLETGKPIRQISKLQKITDYPAHLEAAWQEHLAPRSANAPTVISTFSGAGGSSLGYSMAGFKELLAVEWDDNAVETFKLNFPDVPVYHGDIAALSVEQVLSMTGLQVGELDVFDGSPPCQGFSTAGKRDFGDSRNQLFREYVRLLQGLRPKVFVMENVSGMVKGKMKLIFAEILRELKGSGYKVSARLLNAMYFGVPQSRQRMIFIGVREDLGIEPSHPVARAAPISLGNAVNGIAPSEVVPLSDLYTGYWQKAKLGDAMGKSFADWKADPLKPSNTIRKGGKIAHWSSPRWLALNEFSACASFPLAYRWIDRDSALDRIGNSVPPLLMKAISSHIRHEILDKIEGDK